MATVERSSVIKAPVDTVFAYLDDPLHLPEIWPSLIEIRDVKDLAQGGHEFHWTYKMAGVRLEGDTTTVEFEPKKHVVTKSTGEIPSTFEWTFAAENGSTRFTLKVDYEMPDSLVGKVTEPFVRKLNEHEADAFVANLKDRIEA